MHFCLESVVFMYGSCWQVYSRCFNIVSPLIFALYFKCFGSYHIGFKTDHHSSAAYLDTPRLCVLLSFFFSRTMALDIIVIHLLIGMCLTEFIHTNENTTRTPKGKKKFAVRFLFGFVMLFDDCNFSSACLLTYSLSLSISVYFIALTVAVIVLCVCLHSFVKPRTKIGM